MKKTTEWEREGEGKCVIKEDFCVCTHIHIQTHTHMDRHIPSNIHSWEKLFTAVYLFLPNTIHYFNHEF